VRIIGNDEGWVSGIECRMMELGEPDDSGRRRPKPIADSEYVIDCDMVVVAIGTRSNPMLTSSEPDLKINEWGYLVVDDDGMTSVPGIFAGGDIVRGAATVILAMGDGKRAARAIERYLDRVNELLPGAIAKATATGEAGAEVGT
jgi:glutamate synthase (NADPH/NADH) small chain